MYSLSFKPYMHSTITVGAMAVFLTFSDLLGKRQIACGHIHSLDIVIVATSWYLKEPAHLADWIFILVTIDHHIFYACPHFLSVSERKSRNNSTSICNRLFSYLYSCNVFAGFLPRRFGTISLCAVNPHQLCIAHLLIPYSLLNEFTDCPFLYFSRIFSLIPSGYFFIPIFPDIKTPPMVVL